MSASFFVGVICPIVLANVLLVGVPGSGKSTAASMMILDALASGKWVLLCDGHGDLARSVVVALDMINFNRHTIYDKLSIVSRVVGWNPLVFSTHENKLERRKEDDTAIRGFLDIIARTRGIRGLLGNPLIAEFSVGALRLVARQIDTVHKRLKLAMFALLPGTLGHKILCDGCDDPLLAEKFRRLPKLHSPTYRREVSPAERFLATIFEDPVFAPRMEGAFQPEALFDTGGFWAIDASEIAKDSATLYQGAAIQRAIAYAKRTRKPGVIVIDEAVNFNLLGDYELEALNEARKFNLVFVIGIQWLPRDEK